MPLVTPRGDRSRRGPAPEMAHTRLSARVKVLRRPIRYLRVPGQTFQATLMQHGMSRVWAERLAGRMAQVDQGLYNAEPRTPQSTTPTSFRQWCEDVLKPAFVA